MSASDIRWCPTCVEEQQMREERMKHASYSHIINSVPPYSHNSQSVNTLSKDDDGTQNSDELVDYDSSDDEFEMELNHDFKKFLEESARHRELRKKQKETVCQTDDYIEVNEIPLEATTVAPTQQQGVLRTEEMKALYGSSAHDIESLETSLQLHFNMNVDMRNPVLWPNIPLKF